MKQKIIITIILLSVLGSLVFSQDSQKWSRELSKETQKTNDVATQISASNSSIVSPFSNLEFFSTKEGQSIKINLAFDISDVSLNFAIVSPTSSSGEALPFTLEGLADSTTFELGLQKTFWKPKPNPNRLTSLQPKYKDYLIEYVENTVTEAKFNDDLEIQSFKDFFQRIHLSKQLKIDELTTSHDWVNVRKDYKAYKDAVSVLKSEVIKNINSLLLRYLIFTTFTDDFKLNHRDEVFESFDWGIPVLLGANFKFGKKEFSYVEDTTTFDILETTKTNWAARVALGWVFGKLTVVVFSWQYRKVYEGGKEFEFQIPYEDNENITYTKKLVVGAPTSSTDHRLKLELKRIFSNQLGINPNINYFLNEKLISFNFPIYMLRLKEKDVFKGLNGGIFVEWSSDISDLKFKRDNFSAGVFIRGTFNKLTNLF